ncbi:7638_t:CDS:2 [Paraglomus brasilianum]|uniref:7638_t:CDS:1 n=1 Tax=Paraglomus brasilianum TaxID=144538 RepID=A0A9N9GJZ0_9GLOM|nr:7638_t:CDS:2 [Paraglomus brasilianum]
MRGRQVYKDRVHAGNVLADAIAKKYNNENNDIIVLALPRGGVPVAYQISQRMKTSLDVFLVRKIGVEGHEELAMGAISETATVFNKDVISQISEESIRRVIAKEAGLIVEKSKQELQRRNLKYRRGKPPVNVSGKIVILVDDGIATGATMKAAYKSLQEMKPKKIVVAVPVGAPDTINEINNEVDDVICPLQPAFLMGIGMWYLNFDQTEDAEVLDHLTKAESQFPVPTVSPHESEKLQEKNVVELNKGS